MIKPQFLSLLFFITFISCNRTTQNVPRDENSVDIKNAPEIKFEEIFFDFGDLNEGEKVNHAFKFKNVGKSPLLIADVSVQCGCTVASKPEKPIAPNESNEIVVQFNTSGKAGVQKKFVTITSNAIPEKSILSFAAIVKNAAE